MIEKSGLTLLEDARRMSDGLACDKAFALPSQKVNNQPCWDVTYAVGLPTERELRTLCSEVPRCNLPHCMADFVPCDWVVHRAHWNNADHALRLSNRFLTIDYKEEYYTKEGLDWVESSTMKKVLLRNFPEVAGLSNSMQKIENAFYVWNK